ncbi:MAG: amidohydrolase family protein [Planctomycetota bacterium]
MLPTTPACHGSTAGTHPINDANRLGLDFSEEAGCFGYDGPIIDVHTHVSSPDAAAVYLKACDDYGVERCWTMTGRPNVQPIRDSLGDRADRIQFICVPNFADRENPSVFNTGWYEDIEAFYALGSRVIKYWAAPRGRDFVGDDLLLDSPTRLQGMKIAYETGYRVWMTHVGDPDTWFATAYRDAAKYGTKLDQFVPLERLLDQYDDVTWIGAHMGGNPEDLDWLHEFLQRHPNYVLDCSATKWQVRELSKHPRRLAQFIQANPGRVLFGSDIVAGDNNVRPDPADPEAGYGYDLYASRYWALRTLFETGYDGPSPIVDPDLHKVDPSVDPKSTPTLRGAGLSEDLLKMVYQDAPEKILGHTVTSRSG